MKELDPGHLYELGCLDSDTNLKWALRFVKREGPGFPGNVGHYPGTNIQEVLRALIYRTIYLQRQIPCWQNWVIIKLLRTCIHLLEHRAAKRHRRKFKLVRYIETKYTNPMDGHIHYENILR